jgi:hypothetical protein
MVKMMVCGSGRGKENRVMERESSRGKEVESLEMHR